jgi:hypothetical protein
VLCSIQSHPVCSSDRRIFFLPIALRESGRNSDPDPEIGLNVSGDESNWSLMPVMHVPQEKRNDGGDVKKA